MVTSSCTISFFRNDLQRTDGHKCPIKNCSSKNLDKVKFQKVLVPFCPEHGLRIHKNTFVYYNGQRKEDLATAIKRNLMFNPDYYVTNILNKPGKVETNRLCYENSEDAVTYNVFTELFTNRQALSKLVKNVTGQKFNEDVELYL
jgi:hypothetical protein